MISPLAQLTIVTIATIISNFTSERIWQAFHPEPDEKTVSSHVFWHTFSYAFPLIPLAMILIGKGIGQATAITFLANIIIFLLAILAIGVSTSSISFLRKAKVSQRIDGEWKTPLAESVPDSTMKLAWGNTIIMSIIAILWIYTFIRF
ncbi:MAG: hypothetical protein H8D82_01695 [Euryarchaeota archaeon]|nr:hypothetical protein [Euryarchaeota archaeon]